MFPTFLWSERFQHQDWTGLDWTHGWVNCPGVIFRFHGRWGEQKPAWSPGCGVSGSRIAVKGFQRNDRTAFHSVRIVCLRPSPVNAGSVSPGHLHPCVGEAGRSDRVRPGPMMQSSQGQMTSPLTPVSPPVRGGCEIPGSHHWAAQSILGEAGGIRCSARCLTCNSCHFSSKRVPPPSSRLLSGTEGWVPR